MRFSNWLHPHQVRALSLSTGFMWHSERKKQYGSAFGFTRIERASLSLSTGSMWHPERKPQYVSATGFTRIERVPLSLSTGSMWHPERKRPYASDWLHPYGVRATLSDDQVHVALGT
ncbi:hypothetical protein MRX96_017358 [Rhipicephalus microplus]